MRAQQLLGLGLHLWKRLTRASQPSEFTAPNSSRRRSTFGVWCPICAHRYRGTTDAMRAFGFARESAAMLLVDHVLPALGY